jgi:hypothetical protein
VNEDDDRKSYVGSGMRSRRVYCIRNGDIESGRGIDAGVNAEHVISVGLDARNLRNCSVDPCSTTCMKSHVSFVFVQIAIDPRRA